MSVSNSARIISASFSRTAKKCRGVHSFRRIHTALGRQIFGWPSVHIFVRKLGYRCTDGLKILLELCRQTEDSLQIGSTADGSKKIVLSSQILTANGSNIKVLSCQIQMLANSIQKVHTCERRTLSHLIERKCTKKTFHDPTLTFSAFSEIA